MAVTRRVRALEDWERGRDHSEGVFNFCKTARKPYDLVVCGLLLLLQHHARDCFKISSDGDNDDWRPAAEWVTRVLPHVVLPFELILN